MKCSNQKCGSDDVFLCSVAYEQGTTKSSRSGSYTSHDGGAGDFESETVTRTPFAEKAAPPDSGIGVGLGLVFATWAFAWIADSAKASDGWWYAIALYFVAAVVFFLRRLFQLPAHYRRMAVWRKSWICKRCGAISRPEE